MKSHFSWEKYQKPFHSPAYHWHLPHISVFYRHRSTRPLFPLLISFIIPPEAYVVRYLWTYEQILANALGLMSGRLTGQLSQDCLRTFGPFYRRASAGARVSQLMDRLASAEVTFWQTSLAEMPNGLTFLLYATKQSFCLVLNIFHGRINCVHVVIYWQFLTPATLYCCQVKFYL